jgi:hypothetical protein
MPKRSSKRKRRSKALPTLGFAGVSLSMASGACASTDQASANTPPPSQGNELFLGEEELSDVSLATFYVFDKENAGTPPLAQDLKLARGGCGGCGCGGCHGCGGGGCHIGGGGCACAAARGCAMGFARPGGIVCASGVRPGIGVGHPGFGFGRCRCAGFRRCFGCGCVGCGGCGGCGGTCWIWTPTWGWVYSCWGSSTPPGEASPVASEQSTQTADVKADGAKRTK